MASIPQAVVVGYDGFKQGAGMAVLHPRKVTVGAAVQYGLEVTGGKTSSTVVAGAQEEII